MQGSMAGADLRDPLLIQLASGMPAVTFAAFRCSEPGARLCSVSTLSPRGLAGAWALLPASPPGHRRSLFVRPARSRHVPEMVRAACPLATGPTGLCRDLCVSNCGMKPRRTTEVSECLLQEVPSAGQTSFAGDCSRM